MSYSTLDLEIQTKQNLSFKSIENDLKQRIFEWFCADLCHLEKCLKLAKQNDGFHLITNIPKQLLAEIESITINFDCIIPADFKEIVPDGCRKNIVNSDYRCGSLQFKFYFYNLFNDIMQNNFEEDLPATFHTLLPSKEYRQLWESLIFESDIRDKLLNYVITSLMFAKHNVNSSIITWNKVVLLHGPPGTGKTSLCKALAQKLSIRLYNSYKNFQLIEINSHSLFSKWFSESGKLVMKLFDGIRDFAEDGSNLIFVLIDEVESLAYDRQRTSSSDPSDAIRVVNALLTQIDSIRKYSNVVILSNSNVTTAMDNAFLDRVDIKQYIGLPSPPSIYKIYQSCIKELFHSNIVSQEENLNLISYSEVKLILENDNQASKEKYNHCCKVFHIVGKSTSFSGRNLRKLPFLAIALYSVHEIPIKLDSYLDSLEIAVEKQLEDNEYFNKANI